MMRSEARACKLIPPCKERHDSHHNLIDRYGVKKPIGKYYFTEEALRHDLAALKRGEVYGRDEFYKRAKAWYKAEIDRLLHLKQVEEVSMSRRGEGKQTTNPLATAPGNVSVSDPTQRGRTRRHQLERNTPTVEPNAPNNGQTKI